MRSPAPDPRPDGAKTLFHRDRDGRLGASLHDGGRGISQVVRNHLREPSANLLLEALPPGGWADPSGPTTEGASRLDVEGLVPDHPCGRRANAEIPRRGQEHAGPRFPTGAVGQDVMRTVVHGRDTNPSPPKGGEHRLMDPGELSLGHELPSGGILVRDDHQPPARVLKQAHPGDRPGEELELRRRPDVARSPAVDHSITIEEHGRLTLDPRPLQRTMPLHPQGATGVGRLQEEFDEPPLGERIPRQRESLVDGEPGGGLDLVRVEPELLGPDVAAVDEAQRVGGLAGKTRHVDVDETIEGHVRTDLLFGLSHDPRLRPFAIVHEPAWDVPIPFREPADRFDHEDPRSLRNHDLGDAPDHRGVDRPLDERIDIGPLEDGIATHPFLRVMVEPGRPLLHLVGAEIHRAVRIGPEGELLARPGEPKGAAIPDQVDLSVRLDEDMFAGRLPRHSRQRCPCAVLNGHGTRRSIADLRGDGDAVPEGDDRRDHPRVLRQPLVVRPDGRRLGGPALPRDVSRPKDVVRHQETADPDALDAGFEDVRIAGLVDVVENQVERAFEIPHHGLRLPDEDFHLRGDAGLLEVPPGDRGGVRAVLHRRQFASVDHRGARGLVAAMNLLSASLTKPYDVGAGIATPDGTMCKLTKTDSAVLSLYLETQYVNEIAERGYAAPPNLDVPAAARPKLSR